MFLYTIYDKVSKDFAPIFEQKNDETAIRAVKNELERQPVNPAELALYRLGSFEHDAEKEMSSIRVDHTIVVGSLSEIVNSPSEQEKDLRDKIQSEEK